MTTPDSDRPTPPAPAGTVVAGDAPPSPVGTVAMPPPPTVPGYEIVDVLGRGGMGVVYRARHVSLGRIVALKMILSGGHAGPAEVARFRAEVEAVARLSHPGIVPVFEVGESDGLPWCALEFCPGGTLEKRLAGQALPAREAAGVVRQLAQAVQHAHAHNIVHRDLKPANVLIADDGTLKVTDFGLAKHADGGELTASGAMMGTPSYMAPEQWTDARRAGPAADVWALGVILYEALTGRKPFVAETTQGIRARAVNEEPTAVGRAVPADLDVICRKCLRKEPSERYASAEALAEDLRRWEEGKPITARPVGSGERAVKWVRRNPAVTALLALVVAVLVGGAAVATWFGLDAREQARLARKAESDAEEQAQVARKAEGDARQRATEAEEARGAEAKPKEAADTEKRNAVARANAEQKAKDEANASRIEAQRERDKAVAEKERSERLVYVGKIALAQAEWERGDVVAAHRALDECRWDLRGWEHDYLWSMFHQNQATFKGPAESVNSLAFSPDGKHIVSGSGDFQSEKPGEIKVWNASTGQVTLTLQGHAGYVNSVAFSPDGKRIVSGSGDDTVKVWDATTGQDTFKLKGHANNVTSLAFSPNGKRIMSRDVEGTVKVWDAVAGVELLDAEMPPLPGDAGKDAILPDGRRFEAVRDTILVTDPRRPDSQAAVDRERLARWAQPDPAYHRREADAAEKANQPFAAAFHLQRLLDLAPTDADTVRKRLADARAKLKE